MTRRRGSYQDGRHQQGGGGQEGDWQQQVGGGLTRQHQDGGRRRDDWQQRVGVKGIVSEDMRCFFPSDNLFWLKLDVSIGTKSHTPSVIFKITCAKLYIFPQNAPCLSSFSGFAEQQLQIWFPLVGEKTGLQNTKGFYQGINLYNVDQIWSY